ncbi:hypothetical protein [Desulfovermiculus halophilus]|uniref:hypothetical protein n=1 Tax=Desulfovermiculus halophilus TaxID=339722 RepID=UPI0004897C53|nr:hypothetical protein [Desulfovermiculus halophilus]
MKYILNQTISSTHEDSQGEKNTKEFLLALAERFGERIPLHQHHDMRLETLGYLKNFKVVPDEESSGEWLLKADVYFSCETIDEALGGFSYSITEPISDNFDVAKYQIYLPWPHYNNQDLIDELLSEDKDLAVGKWRKKTVDPDTVGLIYNVAIFMFAPLWTNVYNNHVAPMIKKLFSKTQNLKSKGLSIDFIQQAGDFKGELIQIQFIPDRGNEEKCLKEQLVYEGLKKVENFLKTGPDANTVGIVRVKLMYDIFINQYRLIHVQYKSGKDKRIP